MPRSCNVVSGISKPPCCRLTLTFTLTSVNLSPWHLHWPVLICHYMFSITGRYSTIQSKLRTSGPQLLSYKVWTITTGACTVATTTAFVSLGEAPVGYPLFTLTWPIKHSSMQGWESIHRLHIYSKLQGRMDLDFMSLPKNDGESWERFSESEPQPQYVETGWYSL